MFWLGQGGEELIAVEDRTSALEERLDATRHVRESAVNVEFLLVVQETLQASIYDLLEG